MKMVDVGKQVRYDRIVRKETGKTVMIPFDHGMALGPLPGIDDVESMVKKVLQYKGADALIFQPALAKFLFQEYENKCSCIFKLTNSCTDGSDQVLVSSVEEAIKLGGDAVSVEVLLGSKNERKMLENTKIVSESCRKWGMPLLIMVYIDESHSSKSGLKDGIKHAARAAAELGADIVKTAYTGDPGSFSEVVNSCPAPVIIAGGPVMKEIEKTFQMVRDGIDAGAIGVAMGRNIWQSKDPARITMVVSKIIHDGISVNKAMELLNT